MPDFDEHPDPADDWQPVDFHDPDDFERRQDYPDPDGWRFD